jgi:hypothetical protein
MPIKSMVEDGSDVDMADDAEAESSPAPAKKPAKIRKLREVPQASASIQAQFKKLRGKRGLLKDVVDMPMDVLYEVYHILLPREAS